MDPNEFDLITSKEGLAFLQTHKYSDPNELLLNPPKKDFPEVTKKIRLFVDQLISQRKAIKKLPSWKDTPGLIFPPPLSLEQSSSEETADYKKRLIRGKNLIDLTGGMGIDCFALSENFESIHYVERNPDLCAVFRHNSKLLKKDVIRIHHTEATDFMTNWTQKEHTFFFFDPARREENNSKVFKLTDCEPDATKLVPEILKRGAGVLLKTSPMLDISLATSELPHVKEVHLVAVRNELKEVLYLIEPEFQGEPKRIALNLTETDQRFVYHLPEESKAESQLAPVQHWLYEPNVAILKAGAYKLVGQRFGLKKLAIHSHLYTSEKRVENFPGRTFKVISELNKTNLKRTLPDQKANIITRNYPLTPDQIKKKYKLKDGGDHFVVGTQVRDQPSLFLCRLEK